MDLLGTFGADRPIIGMVHLPPLPGAPRYDGDLAAIRERAAADAAALEAGGVDGVMVENFGDAPFHPDDVPKHTVAALTAMVETVRRTVDLPVGINVLRNDGPAAVGIAAATGADFLRVNIHTGARVTDQGVIQSRAHETLRLRDRLGADVAVLADIDVKHSAPLAGEAYEAEAFAEATERGLADAVVLSGARTGRATDRHAVEEAVARRREAGLETPVFVGSGVSPDNVTDLLEIADGAIVGTALKRDGETTNPVDRERVERLVAAADR